MGREGIDIILMQIPTGERPRESSRSPGRFSGVEELGSGASESGLVDLEGGCLPAFTPLPLRQIDFPRRCSAFASTTARDPAVPGCTLSAGW